MNKDLKFEPNDIQLIQLLARRKAPKPGETVGYSISLRMVSAERTNETSSSDPQMRFSLECLAWEMAEMSDENIQIDMSVDTENPATRAEVQCVFSVEFTTDHDPNDDSINQDEANALLDKCLRFSYPYIRERMRQASFDVFDSPLVLPINYNDIQTMQ